MEIPAPLRSRPTVFSRGAGAASFSSGQRVRASGTVQFHWDMQSGALSAPWGHYLVLPRPIVIDGFATDRLFLGQKGFVDGQRRTIEGRLGLGTFGNHVVKGKYGTLA